jgi:hypothetical protein
MDFAYSRGEYFQKAVTESEQRAQGMKLAATRSGQLSVSLARGRRKYGGPVLQVNTDYSLGDNLHRRFGVIRGIPIYPVSSRVLLKLPGPNS